MVKWYWAILERLQYHPTEVVRLASEKMELPVCEENPLDLNERDPKKELLQLKQNWKRTD